MIVTHFCELPIFEFSLYSTFKDNELRLWGQCTNQMLGNKSWVDVVDLFVPLTISNHPVAGSIIVMASRESILLVFLL
jgi:hypothetical protein